MCVGLVSEVCEFVFEGVPDACRSCSEIITFNAELDIAVTS